MKKMNTMNLKAQYKRLFEGKARSNDQKLLKEDYSTMRVLLREANENPMLKELEQRLKSHDWWYPYSDDHRYFLRGGQEWKEIRELVAKINDAGLEKEAEAIWKKTAPADFKTWYPKKLTK